MKKTIIIAEAGVNHNGDIHLAKKLIDAASNAKVDYVKFQTFKAENLVSKGSKKAPYQNLNSKEKEETQFEMLKKLELDFKDHQDLIKYCAKKKIKFLSSAFDIESIKFLDKLELDFFKIPSGEITNYDYLKSIAVCGKKVIMSSGLSNLEEIQEALQILLHHGLRKEDVTILHCNTEYPTPLKDVNLKAMLNIQENFKVNVGYSDHTLGIEVAIAAVALGATVIEKHFTLNKDLPGPDHSSSLNPDELIQLVKSIRNIEKAISGNGQKTLSKSEKANLNFVRKSLHVNKNLKKGTLIKKEDIISLRPGDGISPMDWEKVIGKKLKSNKLEFEKLNLNDFE